jgi:molybdate transport system substrate-binding protein
MSDRLRGISSMATRLLLSDLASDFLARSGVAVAFESVGGVDAARRVRDGEAFDVVVLASDAIDQLAAGGGVVAGSRTDVVRSGVAIAVRAGAPRPAVDTEDALRRAVLAARSVGYSTGPSGTALLKLLDRWALADTLRARLVQAPAGVPVGALVARGEVELGFQQLSELMHLEGIDVIGPMPPGCEILTVFSAGLCAASARPGEVRALLDFLRSPETATAKRRHGMEPA